MVNKIKDKWGNTYDISEFENKGYGAFKQFVQKNIDEDWGRSEDKEIGIKKYGVSMMGKTTVSAYTEVYAENEEEAKKMAIRKNVSWSIVDEDDIDDIEYEVEEAEAEDE